jgi:signal peptidase II
MQKENRLPASWRLAVFAFAGLFVIIADQLSKGWIRANLSYGQVLSDWGFFRIIRVHNTGAAFGIFRDNNLTLAIIAIVGIIAVVVLIYFLARHWAFLNHTLVWLAVALAVGGTVGNQIDRLSLGYVTDFLDFKLWPTFNVADSAVTVAVILVAYHLIFQYKSEEG